MSITEMKQKAVSMIQSTEDEATLKELLSFLEDYDKENPNPLWKTLSEDELNELIESYEESFDPKNQLTLNEFLNRNKKWFTK